MNGWHLTKRFFGSWSNRPVTPGDLAWVASVLSEAELALWRRHVVEDQRHTVRVARRFVARRPAATRPEVAGALLHDIGKVDVGLSVFGRVVARLVGPRTGALRAYLDHENIGAERLEAIGSHPDTVTLARGTGPAFEDLRAADTY